MSNSLKPPIVITPTGAGVKGTHLAVESPQFVNRPHIWIQWKGTDVCCDIHCACGAHLHFDGEFFYEFQCPRCQRYWEVGTHVALYEQTRAQHEKRGCAQVVEPDHDFEARS